MSEKFCLRWNDFETNISSAFREIREEKDFFDVTLACDEDQLQAHKVILSACSPFFRTILRRNRHEHPLLYMKGVRYTDLQSVLNFMYHGEVNIAQEHLNSFLTVAEELQVKGLTQKNEPESKSRGNVKKQKEHQSPEVFHVDPAETQDDEVQEVAAVKTEPAPAVSAAVPESGVVAHYQDQQEYGDEEYAETEYGYEDTGAYDEAQGGAHPDNSQGERCVPWPECVLCFETIFYFTLNKTRDGRISSSHYLNYIIGSLIVYVRAHERLEKFRICMFVFHAIFPF